MKTALLAVLLLSLLILHPYNSAAQSTAEPSVAQPTTKPFMCEYEEKREEKTPINPKTNKPYTPDERNQEPFDGGSISKDEIKKCLLENMNISEGFVITEEALEALQSEWSGPSNYWYKLQGIKGQEVWGKEKFLALIEETIGEEYALGVEYAPDKALILKHARIRIPIKNHHISFEEYYKAWRELADETKNYAIPLLLEGGVIHDKTRVIRLGEFSDPNAKDVSDLKPDEQKAFGLEEENEPIALIRPEISWKGVSINSDSAVRNDMQTIFSGQANFSRSAFRGEVNFSGTKFMGKANLNGANFSEGANFELSTFRRKSDFRGSNFSKVAYFRWSKFYGEANFIRSKFSKGVNFSGSTFNGEVDFRESTFNGTANFMESKFKGRIKFSECVFSQGAFFNGSKFSKYTHFTESTFVNIANFSMHTQLDEGSTTFYQGADFRGTNFSGEADFTGSTFSEGANFSGAQFKDNADFRNMFVKTLVLDDTTWEKRIDFRGMSAKKLQWDSTQNPSNVKGVVDFREALIGLAIFKEVRFQDLVDFSRTTFGRYRMDSRDVAKLFDDLELMNADFMDFLSTNNFSVLSEQVRLENNTFEKEADFLHITFDNPALFINNRFRNTLDLTGATFGDKNGHLCLSFNRINRLILEPKHLGNLPGFNPFRQIPTLGKFLVGRWDPLEESKVRQVVQSKCAPIPQNVNPEEKSESLSNLYKNLGESFRAANDQGGLNATFYLQQVAEPPLVKPFSWLFLDLPSRYAMDVWRTVWVSIFIMIFFYPFYIWAFLHLAKSPNPDHSKLYLPKHGDKQRAFRLRLFERIYRQDAQKDVDYPRPIRPWRDAGALSFRSFTKIGLGSSYPNTMGLKVLIGIEWILGVYMLIHFSMAVKNNLPFIAPFLEAVN